MQTLYVVGGGRWARVIASEALKIKGADLQVVVVSAKNRIGMEKWSIDNFSPKQISVRNNIPEIVLTNSFAYVANETRNRYATLSALVRSRMPIIVEKPFMLNYKQCEEIINLYKSNEVFVASSQVFRFMEGLLKLKKVVTLDEVVLIEFSWCDMFKEIRNGETKFFEKDVPIYFDILPHIYSILSEVFGELPINLVDVKSAKPSQEFSAFFKFNHRIDTNVFITRVGKRRERIMRITTFSNLISFDFTVDECIQISQNGVIIYEQIFEKGTGIQKMLSAFLHSEKSSPVDYRLEINTVFTVIRLCEIIQQKLLSIES